jgi:NTE family protein
MRNRPRYGIISLHPAKQDYLSTDYDGVEDRNNDIIFHDRLKMSQFYYLIFASLVNSLIKIADEKGANKGALEKILDEETRVIYLGTGNPMFRGK